MVRTDFGIPDSFGVVALIAIEKRGPKENLPKNLQGKGGNISENHWVKRLWGPLYRKIE
jgi:hypothetical protein